MDLYKRPIGVTMVMVIAWNSLCGFIGDCVAAVANRWRFAGLPRSQARPTLDDLKSFSRRELVDIGLDPVDAPGVTRETWLDFRTRI